MNDEPDIVKELRKEELMGLFGSQLESLFEESDSSKTYDDNEKNAVEKLEDLKNKFKEINIKEKYKTIFENYFIGITFVDNKERIISWNKYVEELLNLSEKELYLKPVSSLYPNEEWLKIRHENVRQKGIKHRMETKMYRKDQGIFDVELSLCVLSGAEGKPVGSIGLIKDISKLKDTERNLKEFEDRYRTIFDNSAVGITLTDENERIISWNKFTEYLLSMDKDDLFMRPVKTLYPQNEWKKIRSENIRQKGMQHSLETVMLRKNNNPICVNLSLSVIKDYTGKIIGSIGVIQNNDERKKMENVLRDSEKKYKQLFERAPIPYHTLSLSGKITNVNEKWCETLGYTRDEVIGKQIFNFIDKKERDAALKSFNKKLKGKKTYTGGHERRFITKSGKEKIFIIHDFLSFDDKDNIKFVQTTMEDISVRKKTEEELKKAYSKVDNFNKTLESRVKKRTSDVESLLKQKDEFINQLSHDLRSPLTPLTTLLPMIEKKEKDPEIKKHLDVIIRNVTYLNNLVKKTIELARLNTTKTHFILENINLRHVVNETIKIYDELISGKKITINNNVSGDLIVKADKIRLNEVLNNLISNSLKYSNNGGKIIIDAKKEKDFVKISVKDSGIGLEKKEFTKVFEEFYKSDWSRHDHESSGLGLAICKSIVEKHGGCIWAESPGIGEGSTFYFSIPLGENIKKY
jgi:PAS domain S-box-containing protein